MTMGQARAISRRAVMAGLFGGAVAAVAGALGRAVPADAGSGVVLGADNSEVSTTKFSQTTSGYTALWGKAIGTGLGVSGSSESGMGVFGTSENQAVRGDTTAGDAVVGTSSTGNGGVFSSAGGMALRANGRTHLETSGVFLVAAGKKTRTIHTSKGIRQTSVVLATLESNQAGLRLERVTKNPAADTLTVYLNEVVAAGKVCRISWLFLDQ